MRIGFRVPSPTKRIAARTSLKRIVKNELGLKVPRGWGWLTNPQKAAYNRVYNRTTVGCFTYILCLFTLIILLAVVASAEIYRWEDSNGIHLTDSPSSVPEKFREKVFHETREQIRNSTPTNNTGINKLNVPAVTNQFQTSINQVNTEQQQRTNIALKQQQARDSAVNKQNINNAFQSLARFLTIWIMFGFILFIGWISTIVNIVRSEFTSPSNKTVWLLLVVLLPLLGMLLYYIFGLSQKDNSRGYQNKNQKELLTRLYPKDAKEKDFVI